MLKKIVLLIMAATAFRSSMIPGSPLDRHIGKYLGLPFAHAAISSPVKDASCKNNKVEEIPPTFVWLPDSEKELRKVPFFVRWKVKRNIESYAAERGVSQICMVMVAEAKAHFSRPRSSIF
jgi:hypothetical protein